MEREEVELLPSGLITCLLNSKEVRIMKISPERLTIRLAQEVKEINELKVIFYVFDENRYKEITIEKYNLINKGKHEFYVTYVFSIKDEIYLQNVRNAFNNYTRYIRLKAYSDDNDFSNEMVGYPSEKDYDFYEDYISQKQEWMANLNYDSFNYRILNSVELAINVDNYELYNKYLNEDIETFMSNYLKDNFIEKHKLMYKNISRIYVGNEFCHNLFPSKRMLIDIIKKANNEGLEVTICFTYVRECYIDKIKSIINEIYNWCNENNKKIEIVINDWGMLKVVENKQDYLTLCLGVLLNKRKKDPRMGYKQGETGYFRENSLNAEFYRTYLRDTFGIRRYEWESCGYRQEFPEGKNSIHVPFYQTNTSQYCTLYAACKNGERGKQELPESCPGYCREKVFLYPKHLKMVGRYNSLFALDESSVSGMADTEGWKEKRIDRIVVNLL